LFFVFLPFLFFFNSLYLPEFSKKSQEEKIWLLNFRRIARQNKGFIHFGAPIFQANYQMKKNVKKKETGRQ